MRRLLFASLALALLSPRIAAADEQAEARTILDKAITARGGEAAIKKFTATHVKSKLTAYKGDKQYSLTNELFYNFGTPKMRMIVVDEGRKAEYVQVVNGKSGWSKLGSADTKTMTEAQVAALQERAYTFWIEQLLPLKGAGFRLSPIDELPVGGHDAVGILVRNENHDAVKLYFDKQSYLAVMMRRRAMNPELGREVVYDNVYSDHATVQGMKHCVKAEGYTDGEKKVDAIVTSREFLEKPFDDKLFAKP
jgi:hypothetical protein